VTAYNATLSSGACTGTILWKAYAYSSQCIQIGAGTGLYWKIPATTTSCTAPDKIYNVQSFAGNSGACSGVYTNPTPIVTGGVCVTNNFLFMSSVYSVDGKAVVNATENSLDFQLWAPNQGNPATCWSNPSFTRTNVSTNGDCNNFGGVIGAKLYQANTFTSGVAAVVASLSAVLLAAVAVFASAY
jgi:hypothetical protein